MPVTSPIRRSIGLLVVAAALVGLAIGCGTSGRALRDPVPGATAPPRKGDSTTTIPAVILDATGADARPAGFSLSTTAWAPGGTIPATFTCEGADVSPPLVLNAVPADTAELLLVVTTSSVDSGDRRWIVAGIPPSTTVISQGAVPTGAVEVVNSSGGAQWSGPCPQAGSITYVFTVYTLQARSGLVASSSAAQVDTAIGRASGTATLTGTARAS